MLEYNIKSPICGNNFVLMIAKNINNNGSQIINQIFKYNNDNFQIT